MGRALVLNATNAPISVVSQRRAILLALSDKVEVVANSDRVISSESLSLPIPSILRLRYFVKIPFRRRAPLTRRGVFARDGGKCQYCDSPAESIDHVIPRSKGGEHNWRNVVACCRRCNTYKADRLLSNCGLVLRSTPTVPHEYVWVKAAAGPIPSEWNEYLGAAA